MAHQLFKPLREAPRGLFPFLRPHLPQTLSMLSLPQYAMAVLGPYILRAAPRQRRRRPPERRRVEGQTLYRPELSGG